MKLKAPVENPKDAFCTRGCYRQFHRKRCVVCEHDMERRTEHQLVCGKRRCRNALQGGFNAGRYHAPSGDLATQEVPILRASKSASKYAEAPLNILGGGSFRFPGTPKLDPLACERILRLEVGELTNGMSELREAA